MNDDVPEQIDVDDSLPENYGDVGDVKVVRKRAKTVETELDQAFQFWRQIFATEVGRREMWKILSGTNFRKVVFACGPNGFPQSESTWFNAGQKTYGETLFYSWLRMDPENVVRMLAEHDVDFAVLKDGGRP